MKTGVWRAYDQWAILVNVSGIYDVNEVDTVGSGDYYPHESLDTSFNLKLYQT